MGYVKLIRRLTNRAIEPFEASPVLWLTLTTVPVLLLAILTLRNGAIHIMAPWDVFTLLEGGWAVHSGLIPHTDFYNPIGSLTYVLISIGMRLCGPSTMAIACGNLLFLAVIVPWTWWVAYSRLSGMMSCILTVFVCMLIVAARPLGYDPGVTTYAMIYNRYSWVLLSVLVIQLFIEPRTTGRRTLLLEGISIGGLLALLFFCKISYFVVGVGACALGVVMYPDRWRVFLYAAGTFVLFCLGVKLLFNISSFDYIADLRTAAEAQSLGHRIQYLKNSLSANLHSIYALLLLWLVTMITPVRDTRRARWMSEKVRTTVAIAFMLGATFFIAAGNAVEGADLPLLFAACVILIEFVSRRLEQEHTGPLSASELSYILVLLIAIPVFALPMMAKDSRSVYLATKWKSYRDHGAPASQRFGAEPLRDFVIPHTSEWQTAYWRAKDVPARINDGIALLRRHVTSESKLFVVALTDPFSFALQLVPPKGVPLWWDINFSVSANGLPAPDTIFANVNLVMIPLLHQDDGGCCGGTVERMLEVYGPYFEIHFQEIEHSDTWRLLERKP